MSEEQKIQSQKNKGMNKSLVSGLVIGAVAGFVLCVVVMVSVMPSMMITTEECRYDFDTTVEKLQESIKANGWQVSRVMDMNKSIAKHGHKLEPRVTLIKLCHPGYAGDILTTDTYVSAIMPCTMAVWEGDEGKVYLSEMNMSLMAKMFGGNIAEIMGGKVVKDEEKILEGLLKE